LAFDKLTPTKVKHLLDKYGEQDGLPAKKLQLYFELFKDKNYCLLIFLKGAQLVEPFQINKTGFGAVAAWLTVENINQVRIHPHN
jgi:hypothetical protein